MQILKQINLVSICEIAGLSSISVGCFLIAPFVGFIATGFSLLIFSIAMGRGRNN